MFPGLVWWFTSSLISHLSGQPVPDRFWQGKCEIFILKCILCSLSIRTVDKPTVTKTSLSLCNKSFISTESSLIGKLDPVIMTDMFAGLLTVIRRMETGGSWTDWLTDWLTCNWLLFFVFSSHQSPVSPSLDSQLPCVTDWDHQARPGCHFLILSLKPPQEHDSISITKYNTIQYATLGSGNHK